MENRENVTTECYIVNFIRPEDAGNVVEGRISTGHIREVEKENKEC